MKTVEQVRRERLQMLRMECHGVTKLAERIDKSPSQVSQWLNGSTNSGTGKPRGVSDEVCRDIEMIFEKEVGWMDTDPALISVEAVQELVVQFFRSTDAGRSKILAAAAASEKLQATATHE